MALSGRNTPDLNNSDTSTVAQVSRALMSDQTVSDLDNDNDNGDGDVAVRLDDASEYELPKNMLRPAPPLPATGSAQPAWTIAVPVQGDDEELFSNDTDTSVDSTLVPPDESQKNMLRPAPPLPATGSAQPASTIAAPKQGDDEQLFSNDTDTSVDSTLVPPDESQKKDSIESDHSAQLNQSGNEDVQIIYVDQQEAQAEERSKRNTYIAIAAGILLGVVLVAAVCLSGGAALIPALGIGALAVFGIASVSATTAFTAGAITLGAAALIVPAVTGFLSGIIKKISDRVTNHFEQHLEGKHERRFLRFMIGAVIGLAVVAAIAFIPGGPIVAGVALLGTLGVGLGVGLSTAVVTGFFAAVATAIGGIIGLAANKIRNVFSKCQRHSEGVELAGNIEEPAPDRRGSRRDISEGPTVSGAPINWLPNNPYRPTSIYADPPQTGSQVLVGGNSNDLTLRRRLPAGMRSGGD